VFCPHCNRDAEELSTTCKSCGRFTWYPNVLLADRPSEKEALEDRYNRAFLEAEKAGTLDLLEKFDEAVRSSTAVFAMNIARLRALAVEKQLYSNYDLAIRGHVRRIATSVNDQHRKTVDAKLWGSASDQIRYGALSLDGRGVLSYGECFISLADTFISHRASVLERNSFAFLEDVKIGEDSPLGFRSSWANRHKVAVAKCHREITGMSEGDFASVLLKATSSRHTDDFVEVHIFGPFDFESCQAIRISRPPKTREEQLSLDIVREYATKDGKVWTNDY
jgi:hypothetical protein